MHLGALTGRLDGVRGVTSRFAMEFAMDFVESPRTWAHRSPAGAKGTRTIRGGQASFLNRSKR